ncbi:MAG TPA: hypothetical protein VFM80_11635 [Gracilimonas sp.]|uniref:hypothetical protein n=1 Tax=Gracilimonas sp. TaxID=1974203 RepID=UPI002D8D64E7|nr:hypothetical protein [Gracilimonas sp.]
MATKQSMHSGSILIKGDILQELEYQLMTDLNVGPDFKPIKNGEEIKIGSSDKYLALRYSFKEPRKDGFQIKDQSGNIKLIGFQFRMDRDKGKLWSYNIFKIESSDDLNTKSSETLKTTDHDSDVEPPEPPLP